MSTSSDDRDERHGRRDDPRSTDELIAVALAEPDEDKAWDAIGALHLRGTREVFTRAQRLCGSDDARERRVGVDILGQLGLPARTFQSKAVAILREMLEREESPDVLNSLCVALGHRHDMRAIPLVLRYKNHPDADVRFGVVFGLLGYEDEEAISSLIELSRDADADVRDWATFGLGEQIDADMPAICAALYERLLHDTGEIQGEAMLGLARRRDERVFGPLLAAIEADAATGYSGTLPLDAAAELGDPRLYPALLRLRANWRDERGWVRDALEEAIERCGDPVTDPEGASAE
jgi:HEAT repeat protein